MNRKVKPYHNLSSEFSSSPTSHALQLMDLDQQYILPPTPAALFDIISASPNPDPKHVMDLWEDFDRFIPKTPMLVNMDSGPMLPIHHTGIKVS